MDFNRDFREDLTNDLAAPQPRYRHTPLFLTHPGPAGFADRNMMPAHVQQLNAQTHRHNVPPPPQLRMEANRGLKRPFTASDLPEQQRRSRPAPQCTSAPYDAADAYHQTMADVTRQQIPQVAEQTIYPAPLGQTNAPRPFIQDGPNAWPQNYTPRVQQLEHLTSTNQTIYSEATPQYQDYPLHFEQPRQHGPATSSSYHQWPAQEQRHPPSQQQLWAAQQQVHLRTRFGQVLPGFLHPGQQVRNSPAIYPQQYLQQRRRVMQQMPHSSTPALPAASPLPSHQPQAATVYDLRQAPTIPEQGPVAQIRQQLPQQPTPTPSRAPVPAQLPQYVQAYINSHRGKIMLFKQVVEAFYRVYARMPPLDAKFTARDRAEYTALCCLSVLGIKVPKEVTVQALSYPQTQAIVQQMRQWTLVHARMGAGTLAVIRLVTTLMQCEQAGCPFRIPPHSRQQQQRGSAQHNDRAVVDLTSEPQSGTVTRQPAPSRENHNVGFLPDIVGAQAPLSTPSAKEPNQVDEALPSITRRQVPSSRTQPSQSTARMNAASQTAVVDANQVSSTGPQAPAELDNLDEHSQDVPLTNPQAASPSSTSLRDTLEEKAYLQDAASRTSSVAATTSSPKPNLLSAQRTPELGSDPTSARSSLIPPTPLALGAEGWTRPQHISPDYQIAPESEVEAKLGAGLAKWFENFGPGENEHHVEKLKRTASGYVLASSSPGQSESTATGQEAMPNEEVPSPTGALLGAQKVLSLEMRDGLKESLNEHAEIAEGQAERVAENKESAVEDDGGRVANLACDPELVGQFGQVVSERESSEAWLDDLFE